MTRAASGSSARETKSTKTNEIRRMTSPVIVMAKKKGATIEKMELSTELAYTNEARILNTDYWEKKEKLRLITKFCSKQVTTLALFTTATGLISSAVIWST